MRSRRSSATNKPPGNVPFAALWAAFHAAILLAFGLRLLAGGGLNIDADLFHMLPSSTLGAAMGEADGRLSESTAQNVFVLASHEDFGTAKAAAEQAYGMLKDNPNFTSLALYAGASAVGGLEEFVHPYRWSLLDDAAIAALNADGGAEAFAENALAQVYGAFTLTSLERLDEDPFLLDEYLVQRYLAAVQEAGTAMTPKDGVLASLHEGRWYVMIRGVLSKAGAAIASKTNGIAAIYAACSPLEKDGVRFVYSGTPFHSHQSSTSAVSEIASISTVTFAIVIAMLLAVFRGALPLLASVASILVSLGTAFAATHLAYGQIHVLTLVLGTSLIGSCIDYSLHFFVNWKANPALRSGADIRRHLCKGLALSLLSTEICYVLLVFAPFGLLGQMGVFSSAGILSSFLTVVCVYPLLPLPAEGRRTMPLLRRYRAPGPRRRFTGAGITAALLAAALGILAAHRGDVRVQNDMYKLYTMQGRLKEDNDLAALVTGYSPKGWFIVRGGTPEELLRHEEHVRERLREVQEGGYLATSRFIPSLAHQQASRDAARNLLPLARGQCEVLDLDGGAAHAVAASLAASGDAPLLPGTPLPESLRSIASMLWLGEIEGQYYSVILPVTVVDEAAYVRIAGETDFAYYENKMKDLGLGLDRLTRLVCVLFAVAWCVILLALKFFYSWRQTLKIASIPLMSVLAILSAFMLIGQPVEFFGLTGAILVFGLGLDYIIYMMENARRPEGADGELRKLEPFAILLSFVTTAVSFGALAFSTFVPVHTIGLAIFLGLAAAFACTLF